MAKQVLKITNWVGGLNCATDPRDIEDSQFAQNWNIIDDRGGMLRKVGGAEDSIINLDHDNTNQQAGFGLFTVGADYALSSFDGTFDDGYEKGTLQAYASGTPSVTLAASSSYVSSTQYTTDDFFNNWTILIYSGNGAGESRTISDYVGSSKVATIDAAFSATPDSSSKYLIFRWVSSDFGTSNDNDWITNDDGASNWPDTDGNAIPDYGKYHLISKKTSITDEQASDMGYVELKGSGDGSLISALTITPGIQYYLTFFAKASAKYYGYVSDNPHSDRVPFVTLHHTDIDGSGTDLALFSNNTWIEDPESVNDTQKNYVDNGDLEDGAVDAGTGDAPEAFTIRGDDIACTFETSNEYGAEGNSLILTADGNLEIETEAISASKNIEMTTSSTPDWAEFDESGTMGGGAHSLSGDILTITGTSATSDEGTQLAVDKMTTLIVGRTYRVSASIYSTSGDISGVKIGLGGATTDAFTITEDTTPIEKELLVTDASGVLKIYFETNSTVPWVIDNVSVKGVDPSSFVYNTLTLVDNQYYHLNFVHSSNAGGVRYAIYDGTAGNYIKKWTTLPSTGALTTYKFLNQTIDNLGVAGSMQTSYERFKTPASTTDVRLLFSASEASTAVIVDSITVFKAWNDLVTMSHNLPAANPFSDGITNWQKYSMRFTLPSTYAEKSDWILRLHGGKAGFQNGATNSTDSHTVEFDNIQLSSAVEAPENFTFLVDNGSADSRIKVHSSYSGQWYNNFLNWSGIKSKPVYTNANGVVKIADANFANNNMSKLFFFNDRNIMQQYPVYGYEQRDNVLCSNPPLSLTQATDSELDGTFFDGLKYIEDLNSGLHYKTTNWNADTLNESQGILMRYYPGVNETESGTPRTEQNGYNTGIADPGVTATFTHSTHYGTKDANWTSEGRPIYLWIQGNDGTTDDIGSVMSAAGDVAKVEFEFTYDFYTPYKSDSNTVVHNKPGPVIKVECGKCDESQIAGGTTAAVIQSVIDGECGDAWEGDAQLIEFGRHEVDASISIEQSSQGITVGNSEDTWDSFVKDVGETGRFVKGSKKVSGTFSFEAGDVAKTNDILVKISMDYDTTGSTGWDGTWNKTNSGNYDGPARWEKIMMHALKVHMYDPNYTQAADSMVFPAGDEVRVNWNFGTPSGAIGSGWEGKKFQVGITSTNIFGEENHIDTGNITNIAATGPTSTIYGNIGEGSDGSSNITTGQSPTINVYLGNSILKDTFKKETKFYIKDNESDIWYLQFLINHDTGKIHSATSGYSSLGTIHQDNAMTSWQIPRGEMLSPNQIDTYESETFLSKTYTTENSADMTCRYKTAVVANNRLYVGNIKQGNKAYGDRMIKSPINKYNILPDVNFIDVAINDGDEITALSYYRDKLLQFKRKKVFIVNTSGDYEFLENTLPDIGVDQQCQVTTTPFGIVWANEQGCFVYDGQQVQNLIDGKIAPTSDAAFIGNNYWLISSTDVPLVGYLRDKKSLIVLTKASTSIGVPEGFQYNFITKSWTFLFTRTPDSGKTLHNGTKSNMQIDKDGNLIWHTYYSGSFNKIVKWNDSAGGGNTTPTGSGDSGIIYFRTKDFDFGQPGVRKKVYKVYITYKTTNGEAAALDANFAIDGSTTFTEFSTSKSTNYSASGFADSAGQWKTAILIPTSSINNIYSFALQFANANITNDFAINDISIVYRMKRAK